MIYSFHTVFTCNQLDIEDTIDILIFDMMLTSLNWSIWVKKHQIGLFLRGGGVFKWVTFLLFFILKVLFEILVNWVVSIGLFGLFVQRCILFAKRASKLIVLPKEMLLSFSIGIFLTNYNVTCRKLQHLQIYSIVWKRAIKREIIKWILQIGWKSCFQDCLVPYYYSKL